MIHDPASTSGKFRQPIEADLIADTRDSERRLGLRGRICERRLLFRAPGAYIEMCVPPNAQEGGSWLHGQVVLASPPQGDGSVTATLLSPRGIDRDVADGYEPVEASERGDFALPLPAVQPDQEVCIEIAAPQGRVLARFVA